MRRPSGSSGDTDAEPRDPLPAYAAPVTTYLGILNGSAESSTAPELTEEHQGEFMTAWARWAQEAGPALVDPGRPLFRKRRVTAHSVELLEDARVAYMIISAASHDAAVGVVRGHPHLTLAPGNSIDLLECPELP